LKFGDSLDKIEFKPWKEIDPVVWNYGKNPIGQLWGTCRSPFSSTGYHITNCRGEGFKVHGGTKDVEIAKLIDALNKRDVEIAKLKKNITLR